MPMSALPKTHANTIQPMTAKGLTGSVYIGRVVGCRIVVVGRSRIGIDGCGRVRNRGRCADRRARCGCAPAHIPRSDGSGSDIIGPALIAVGAAVIGTVIVDTTKP